ncbi:hypothetical protein K474DRAFT_1482472 [Panus rudis PR-1116 ss-1]|nr:hypothetical protein K474DRAFT_1482472 [Panus rudis PR-1116 ss-1]
MASAAAAAAVAQVLHPPPLLSSSPYKPSPSPAGATYKLSLPLSAPQPSTQVQKVTATAALSVQGGPPPPDLSTSAARPSVFDPAELLSDSFSDEGLHVDRRLPQPSPHDAPHPEKLSDELRDEEADGPPAELASPPPLPPKSPVRQRSTLAGTPSSSPRESFPYRYAASEPGHSEYYRRELTRPGGQSSMDAVGRGDPRDFLQRSAPRPHSGAPSTYPPSSSPASNEHGVLPSKRNKLRKLRPSRSRTDLSPAPMPVQRTHRVLQADRVIDLTYSPTATYVGRSRPAFSENRHEMVQLPSPCPPARPRRPQYPSVSTNTSCASAYADSMFSNSPYNSTAPTSPSATSDSQHRSSYYSHSYTHPSSYRYAHQPSAVPPTTSPAPTVTPPSPISPRKLLKKRPPQPPPIAPSGHEARSIENGGVRTAAFDGAGAKKSIFKFPLAAKIKLKESARSRERAKAIADAEGSVIPPMRPSSPLWAGTGPEKLPSPYELSNSPPSSSPPAARRTRSHTGHGDRTSRALTDLAFTGTTVSDISSTAVAAFTSRLSVAEYSPERYDPNWDGVEPDYDPYEAKSDGGYTECESVSEWGHRTRGRSETGHTSTHSQVLPSRSSSISFLNTDPYPQARYRPRKSFTSQVAPPIYRHSHEVTTASPSPPQSNSSEGGGGGGFKKVKGEVDTVTTMRRWTLAMTDVSDEMLVHELERLRREAGLRGRARVKKKASVHRNEVKASPSNAHVKSPRGSGCDFIYGGPEVEEPQETTSTDHKTSKFHLGQHEDDDSDGCKSDMDDDTPPTEDSLSSSSSWKIARRALLCCRELVLTERTYQTQLRRLLSGDIAPTAQHPRVPALVVSYIEDLISASEAFLSRLEDDPSAWGVSTAWLGCEEELESAFVAWCGVVGELFVDRERPSLHSQHSQHSQQQHTQPRHRHHQSTTLTSSESANLHRTNNTKTGVAAKVRRSSTFVNLQAAADFTGFTSSLTLTGRGRSKSGVSNPSPTDSEFGEERERRQRVRSDHDPARAPTSTSTSASMSTVQQQQQQQLQSSPPRRSSTTSTGMFTAALGTGLPFGLSPPSSPAHSTSHHAKLESSPGFFTYRSPEPDSAFSPTSTKSAPSRSRRTSSFGHLTAVVGGGGGGGGGTGGSLTRTLTAAFGRSRKSILGASSASLPVGLVESPYGYEKREREVKERKGKEMKR